MAAAQLKLRAISAGEAFISALEDAGGLAEEAQAVKILLQQIKKKEESAELHQARLSLRAERNKARSSIQWLVLTPVL